MSEPGAAEANEAARLAFEAPARAGLVGPNRTQIGTPEDLSGCATSSTTPSERTRAERRNALDQMVADAEDDGLYEATSGGLPTRP
jgi:hypothetical protein